MNTDIFDLGKIGITLGYEYNDEVIYEKLTIVLYKGKSYISTKTTQGVSPEQDIETWQLVAEAKDAYHMLVDAGKTTLTEEKFLEQLVDATKGRYIVQGNVINTADEEDLTVEHSSSLGIDTLKLANRPSTDGMGYIILRKNKTFAEQVTKENTIYEIRYDFTLDENVTIPNNCVLKFDGGSISASGSNDTITGNNTVIKADLIKIFNTNVTIAGTFNNDSVYPEWFGAVGDGTITDDTLCIQKAINFAELGLRKKVVLSKSHRINSTLTIGAAGFDGNGKVLNYYGNGTAISLVGSHWMTSIGNFALVNEGRNGLIGIKNNNSGANEGSGLNNAHLYDICMFYFKDYGLHINNAWLCNIHDIEINHSNIGIYIKNGYNSRLRNIDCKSNNIGADLNLLSTSLFGGCFDDCKQIGIKLNYSDGCSFENIHCECISDNAIGFKFLSSSSCTFKNIYASTDKDNRNFIMFDLDPEDASGNIYCTGHRFEDINFRSHSSDALFNLSSFDSNYLKCYDIVVANDPLLSGNEVIYKGGTGIITWLSTTKFGINNNFCIQKVTNGVPSVLYGIYPNSDFSIKEGNMSFKKGNGQFISGVTWLIYRLPIFVGVFKLYTAYGTAIYYVDAENHSIKLIETTNSSIFNQSGIYIYLDEDHLKLNNNAVTPNENDKFIYEMEGII